MSPKIWCVGELLIDFICEDIDSSLLAGQHFVKKAGGAPANVAAAIAKLGGDAAFAGKVGNDPFGHFLKQTLEEVKVDTSMLLFDDELPTTLAFVSLKKDGERDFVFNRGADANLSVDELPKLSGTNVKIIHMGSATGLLGGKLTETYLQLIKKAKERNIFISFDPNFRVDLWKGREKEFIAQCMKCIPYADLVKVSEEEALLISGKNTLDAALEELHMFGAGTITITLGKDGTLISDGMETFKVASMPIKSVDSTGAGDAFIGALLYQLAQQKKPKDAVIHKGEMEAMVAFANKVGAITCARFGAISALPNLGEVQKTT